MKGIILAGGAGTRLYPLTLVTSKQLLPVYDKPMIYYSLSTLMLAGIRDIMIISTPDELHRFEALLGTGEKFGISLHGDDACALILGDNIFYGNGFSKKLKDAIKNAEVNKRATVFGYYVSDPERFGVVDFDENGRAVSIEEKPAEPKSNYAVTGLYFYPSGVSKKAAQVTPSERGELEITSLNVMYLEDDILDVQHLDRGFVWMDTGTVDSLVEASNFIQSVEKRNGVIISAPEEIAFLHKWIDSKALIQASEQYGKSAYGNYLKLAAKNRVKK